eukprot:6189955-Pleurochrysis_carterae.AAC.3
MPVPKQEVEASNAERFAYLAAATDAGLKMRFLHRTRVVEYDQGQFDDCGTRALADAKWDIEPKAKEYDHKER